MSGLVPRSRADVLDDLAVILNSVRDTADPARIEAAAHAAARRVPSVYVDSAEVCRRIVDAAPEAEGKELRAIEKAAKRGYRHGALSLEIGALTPASKLAEALEYEERKAYKRREQQINRELADEGNDRPPLVSHLMDWTGLLAQPDPEWVLEGVIPESGTVIFYGPSGIGKSFVAQSVAAAVAGGYDWLGRPTTKGKVLYVFAEGASGAGKRFQALADAWNKGEPLAGLSVLPIAPDMTSDADVSELEALNAEHDFAVVIFDTLNRVAGSAEENSATAMSGVLSSIERIRRAGSRTTSIIVSHAGKSGDLRGSTAIWAAADTVLELSGEPEHLKLEARKQKDAPEGLVGHLRLKPSNRHDTLIVEGVAPGQGTPSGAVSSRVEESLAHFVRAFGETGATRTQFVDLLVELGVAKKSTAFTYVNDLVKTGRLDTARQGTRGTYLTLPTRTTFPIQNKES